MDDAAHLDFETRSTTDLRKSGVYRYVEDRNTAPWGFKYRIGQGPYKEWRPGYPDPTDLLDHIRQGKIVKAHNAAFERINWNEYVKRWYPHWPKLKIPQMDCTMARAAAIAHPQDLDTLAVVLNCVNKKDRAGHSLMLKMCKPRSYKQDGSIVWWDEPDLQDRQMAYCEQDVRVECEVDDKLPPLTDYERRVWYFDQVINDRGIPMDRRAIEKCAELVEYCKKMADVEMRKLTGRTVPKCTNDAKIIAWIQEQGIECTTVKKGVQDDIIFLSGLHDKPTVKEVIELRRASKKTSTSKYKAMLQAMCLDDFIRGLLNYHGASTGRWAGRLVQPHNFPRVDHEEEGYIYEWLHEMLETLPVQEIYDMIVAVHGPAAPLLILSRALRSMIKAPAGKKLIGGDFANIEGRINALFANATWKLDAFRAYDNKTGPDLYKLAASGILGKEINLITALERQGVGKVSELALGFQGSVGAFISMGEQYNVDVYTLVAPILAATSSAQWDATAATYAKQPNKHGLFEREWTALKIIVDNWRKTNNEIAQLWWDLQDAAIEAVAAPGQVVRVAGGRVQYYSDNRCLWCVLPSGRMLCYSSPRVDERWETYTSKSGEKKQRLKRSVVYLGFDSETRQWGEQWLYGGLQCENVVSGTARDVMVDRQFAVERGGYPVILTVHDEILTLPNDDKRYTVEEFQSIMSELPGFVDGLPLAVKAWEDMRYVK